MVIQNVTDINAELARRSAGFGLDFVVGGDGIIGAELAIVGEAPGYREVEARTPFIGQSGNLLWTQLREHCKVMRMETYVTNVVKRQVSVTASADEDTKVTPGELRYWKELLMWELNQLPNLKYVLVLGNIALQALTDNNGITNWRGSVLSNQNIRYETVNGMVHNKVVSMVLSYNPIMVLREPKFTPVFSLDTSKLRAVMDGVWRGHAVKEIINPTWSEAMDWIDKMRSEKKPVSFDIEITQDKARTVGETVCIGFANNAHEGMCINFRDAHDNRYNVEREAKLYRHIQSLLNAPDVQLVAQNGNFDSYWMWYKDRIKPKSIWFDTMLAHFTLYPLLPHGLGFLTSQYTQHPFYKDEGKNWREDLDFNAFWRYNVKDCCITYACYEKLLAELQTAKLEDFFFNHMMHLSPELVRMTVLGTLCDVDMKRKLSADQHVIVEQLRQNFYASAQAATGDPAYTPNPGSPIQMQDLFYTRLGLPTKGKVSADAKNRDRLKMLPLLPDKVQTVIQCLDKWSEEAKFTNTYADMRVDDDDRLRCDYSQIKVANAPGRLSSSQTMWGTGGNLQNQPERAQKMFIADPGYEFTYTDGAQAEARVVAVIWKVRGLIDNFERAKTEEGFDVHRANASRIFRVPYADIPSYDRDPVTGVITKRFLGKRCVHGLNYRMEAPKLAEVCGIPVSQANDAYYSYHRAFPEIKIGWRETLEEVRRHKMLFTPKGRRFLIMGMNPYEDDEALDSVIAFIPQSTVGDHVSALIYQCHGHKDWPKTARIILNTHDGLVALNELAHGGIVRGIMKEFAETPIPSKNGDIFIPFEFKKSFPGEDGKHRWSDLVKVKE